ncbi:MAG: DNA repair protein RecO [Clostridia bacterium]|nr:DNA repair protein RecO [Clostridia bacterium]
MKDFKVNGIVLRAAPFKESSAVLTLLTAERGKIAVVAQGVRKVKKSGLFAQPFSYSEFVLSQSKGLPVCRSADLKETFYGLREDMDRLAIGQYLLEISLLVGEDVTDGSDFLKLLLNSLYLLSRKESGISPAVVKTVYELKFAALSGYGVDPEICTDCGKTAEYWSFEEGFLCGNCATEKFAVIHPVSSAVKKALTHILSTDGKGSYSFKMSEKAFGDLSTLSEKYLEAKTETRFRALEFISKMGSNE